MSQPAFTGSQMAQLETIFIQNGINLDQMQPSALASVNTGHQDNPSSRKLLLFSIINLNAL